MSFYLDLQQYTEYLQICKILDLKVLNNLTVIKSFIISGTKKS